MSEMNWGKVVFQDINIQNGLGRLLVYNSFETMSRKGTRASCYFLRGYLAGFFSELFEREVNIEEERCAAMQHDCCEFSFR